jgi:hypothetical protein
LGVALERSKRVYVGDYENGRILAYDRPWTRHALAELVLGQYNFTSPGRFRCFVDGQTSAAKLCQPAGVAVDSFHRLWVADRDNSRVLRYDRSHFDASEPEEVDDHN